jgi:hypothetical protein
VLAQLGDRKVGLQPDQFDHPRSHGLAYPALRTRPVAHPLHLPGLRPLAEDLLHIAKAHAKHSRQFAETSMTVRMRQKYLPTQIILIGSRHIVVAAESRLFYSTPSLLSL